MDQKELWRNARKEQKKKYRYSEVKLTPETHALFASQAAIEETGVSTLIGNMALAYLQGQRLPSQAEKAQLESIQTELAELSLLIRNIANNVNQAAHHSNTVGVLVDEQGLLQHLKQLDESVKEAVGKLTQMDKG